MLNVACSYLPYTVMLLAHVGVPSSLITSGYKSDLFLLETIHVKEMLHIMISTAVFESVMVVQFSFNNQVVVDLFISCYSRHSTLKYLL